MSESKIRSRKKTEILSIASRCVYCESTEPTEVEHMPPRGLFKDKDRPSGWEFACCSECNRDTRGADAVAQLFALIEPLNTSSWKFEGLQNKKRAVQKYAPGVLEEFASAREEHVLLRQNGLIRDAVRINLNGALTKKYLDCFALKLAIASFTEFCGRNINFPNFILTEWNLNSFQKEALEITTSIMPIYGELQQGRKTSGGQFSMRYNTDADSIAACLFSLHNSLFITCITTDVPDYVEKLTALFSDSNDREHSTRKITTMGLKELI